MASKTTLNAKNLETLGAARLAELLIEISTGSAASKRRLRIELAGQQGTGDVAREVTKRLSAIERSRSKIGWRGVKALRRDLDTQRRVIVETISLHDPGEAMEVGWRLMNVASPVLARCKDSNGTIIAVFRQALEDLATIAKSADPDPRALANSVFSAAQNNDHGQFDGVIALLAPVLGETGLAYLKTLFSEWAASATGKLSFSERVRMERVLRAGLEQIADAQGDVDGFVALQSEAARNEPDVATGVARRLLSAGRASEALLAISRSNPRLTYRVPLAWEIVYTDILDALGRTVQAQDFRLEAFEQTLNATHLRAYLKRLPDFDDMEAEEKALGHALRFREAHHALSFLLAWPELNAAAKLVMARKAELHGDRTELLSAAAESLGEKHPLAASLILRVMIDFTLERARAGRYRHAARQLLDCARLAARVSDFAPFPSHADYVAGLKARHARKPVFWAALANDGRS